MSHHHLKKYYKHLEVLQFIKYVSCHIITTKKVVLIDKITYANRYISYCTMYQPYRTNFRYILRYILFSIYIVSNNMYSTILITMSRMTWCDAGCSRCNLTWQKTNKINVSEFWNKWFYTVKTPKFTKLNGTSSYNNTI